MADVLKLLYTTSANRVGTTSLTALYTVPPSTTAMVARVLIANITGGAVTARVALLPSGVLVAGILNEHYVAFDVSVPANDTIEIPIGGGLETGVTVAVRASANTSLVFNIFGMEVS